MGTRTNTGGGKSQKKGTAKQSTSFKIRLRGKDGAPLSMTDMRQGLFDIAHRLARYQDYRAKWVTLYLTVVDENGSEVRLDPRGEWTIHPYHSAADDAGL